MVVTVVGVSVDVVVVVEVEDGKGVVVDGNFDVTADVIMVRPEVVVLVAVVVVLDVDVVVLDVDVVVLDVDIVMLDAVLVVLEVIIVVLDAVIVVLDVVVELDLVEPTDVVVVGVGTVVGAAKLLEVLFIAVESDSILSPCSWWSLFSVPCVIVTPIIMTPHTNLWTHMLFHFGDQRQSHLHTSHSQCVGLHSNSHVGYSIVTVQPDNFFSTTTTAA